MCFNESFYIEYINKLPPMPSEEGMLLRIERYLGSGRKIEDFISDIFLYGNRYKDEWIDFFKRHGYIKQ